MARRRTIIVAAIGCIIVAVTCGYLFRPRSTEASKAERVIAPGDKLTVTIVSGESDPPSETDLDVAADGSVKILGFVKVSAAGRTCAACGSYIAESLRDRAVLVKSVAVKFSEKK